MEPVGPLLPVPTPQKETFSTICCLLELSRHRAMSGSSGTRMRGLRVAWVLWLSMRRLEISLSFQLSTAGGKGGAMMPAFFSWLGAHSEPAADGKPLRQFSHAALTF